MPPQQTPDHPRLPRGLDNLDIIFPLFLPNLQNQLRPFHKRIVNTFIQRINLPADFIKLRGIIRFF